MYIPGEHFLTAALELDPTGCGSGRSSARCCSPRRPTSSPSPAPSPRLAAGEAAPRRRRKSPRLGKELHSRLATMAAAYGARRQEPLDRQQRLQPDGRQLRKPGVHPGPPVRDAWARAAPRTCRSPPMVEASPRPLTKLAAPASANEDDAAVGLAPRQFDRPGAARQGQPVAAEHFDGHDLLEDRGRLGFDTHVGAGHAGRGQRPEVER